MLIILRTVPLELWDINGQFYISGGGETRFTPRPSSYKWETLGSSYLGGLYQP